jgi:hypothetical protein
LLRNIFSFWRVCGQQTYVRVRDSYLIGQIINSLGHIELVAGQCVQQDPSTMRERLASSMEAKE